MAEEIKPSRETEGGIDPDSRVAKEKESQEVTGETQERSREDDLADYLKEAEEFKFNNAWVKKAEQTRDFLAGRIEELRNENESDPDVLVINQAELAVLERRFDRLVELSSPDANLNDEELASQVADKAEKKSRRGEKRDLKYVPEFISDVKKDLLGELGQEVSLEEIKKQIKESKSKEKPEPLQEERAPGGEKGGAEEEIIRLKDEIDKTTGGAVKEADAEGGAAPKGEVGGGEGEREVGAKEERRQEGREDKEGGRENLPKPKIMSEVLAGIENEDDRKKEWSRMYKIFSRGERFYRQRKNGELQYFQLKEEGVNGEEVPDDEAELTFILYDKNGQEVKGKDGETVKAFKTLKTLKYREWKKPTEDQLPQVGEEIFGDDVSYKRSTGEVTKASVGQDEEGRFHCVGEDGGESILTKKEIRCYENEEKIAYARVLPSRSEAERRFKGSVGASTGGRTNFENFPRMSPDAQEAERARIDQREMERERQARSSTKKWWQFWK